VTPFDINHALRPALRSVRGYQAIDTPEEVASRYGIASDAIVKLDGNENPYGPSPLAQKALAGQYPVHRYPDPVQRRLRRALATYLDLPFECIVAGAGADEIIDLVFRIFVDSGDRVVIASPSFGMYAFGAQLAGAELIDIPRKNDWSLDVGALATACKDARVVFLPSPNNPTGGLLPPAAYEPLFTSGAIVGVDEAYIEFAGNHETGAPTLASKAITDEVPLIVLRTFSKWAGLAGLRVGYGIMSPGLASTFIHCKQPYGVNIAAEIAALASLEDAAILNERACIIAGERNRLAHELRSGGWLEPTPSEANFLLCRVTSGDGAALHAALAQRGIFVRIFDHERLRDYVRISIGTPQDSDRLLEALTQARSEIEATSNEGGLS